MVKPKAEERIFFTVRGEVPLKYEPPEGDIRQQVSEGKVCDVSEFEFALKKYPNGTFIVFNAVYIKMFCFDKCS